MGEYVKYKGQERPIGTMYNLYYTSYQKFIDALSSGKLTKMRFSDKPEFYARPDSGFWFRFPFPDEDKLPFSEIIEPHNRTVPVQIENKVLRYEGNIPPPPFDTYHMEISQQELLHRESDGRLCLALVYRDPLQNERFRIEDEKTIRTLVGQILKNHVLSEVDTEKKNFYRQIAVRILKGYRMKEDLKTELKKENKIIPPMKRKISKGKGRSM